MTNEFSSRDPMNPEVLDLLIKRSVSGLEPSEQKEFDRLDEGIREEATRLEAAAAAFDIALTDLDSIESVPDSLMAKLEAGAHGFFEGAKTSDQTALESAIEYPNASLDDEPTVRPARTAKPESQTGPPVTRREVVSMLIAAACLLLVFSGLNPLAYNPNANKTSEEKLASFLSSQPGDLVDLDFGAVHQPEAGGRVVWSDKKQEGYMVLTGFQDNDPTKEQYQLWIFDTDPNQAHPVDGGVFDFASAKTNEKGELIVPIDAKINVQKAVQFAVTQERRGGVVVSKREKIPVLAKL